MSVRHLSLRIAAVGCAAAAALLVGSGPAGAAAPPPSTTTDPALAAAGWLAGQFADGNHLVGSYGGSDYIDYGTTADAVYALAAAKAGKATIDAAVAYLAENADAYVDFDNRQGYGTSYGGIAKLAVAAQVSGADPSDFGGRDLLTILTSNECTAISNPDGSDHTQPACPGIGAEKNAYSSISESFVLLAEARGGITPSTDAVSYFTSLQCGDGGFTSGNAGGAGCTSDPDATAYAIMALHALGSQPTALANAVTWLAGRQQAGGYWVAQGIPDVDTTGLAAAALDGAGRDMTGARAWLATQQVTTGPTLGTGASRGALEYAGKFSSTMSAKATADGLLGMVRDGSLATLTATGAAATAPVLALPAPHAHVTSVAQGGTQTVVGTGFAANEAVSGTLHSTPVALGSVRADKNGTATLTFTVPNTLATGTHTVVLTGASGLSSSVTFQVTAAVPASPSASQIPAAQPAGLELAATGRDDRALTGYAVVGGLLVVAGAGLLYAGRRRVS